MKKLKIKIIPSAILAGLASEDTLLDQSKMESIYAIRKLRVAMELVGQTIEITKTNSSDQVYIDSHEIWLNTDEFTDVTYTDGFIFDVSRDGRAEFAYKERSVEGTMTIRLLAAPFGREGVTYFKADGLSTETTTELKYAKRFAQGTTKVGKPGIQWQLIFDSPTPTVDQDTLNQLTTYTSEASLFYHSLLKRKKVDGESTEDIIGTQPMRYPI